MKVLFINSVCGIRSTGRIVTDLAEKYMADGNECRIAYGRENVPEKYKDISYRICSPMQVNIAGAKSRIFDNEGFNATSETKKFIKWAEEYNPDLLWLHNLHGYYINVEILFEWIKSRPQMEVKWTFHDCWNFTGHCCHFSFAKCGKWKSECKNCCQTKRYPISLFRDNSKNNFYRKRKVFTGVKNLTIITPSYWLSNLVKESFLKEYPCVVVYNEIDKSIFTPRESDFRQKYGLEDKKIVLGVATAWSERKGLFEFARLSETMDKQYKIVLVGLKESQMASLPDTILKFPCTDNATELAEIYTASDVFLNLSKEETFGLTTLEALSCGTPSIVYKGTACEEVAEKYGGIAVEQDLDKVIEAIYSLTDKSI